MDGRLQQDFTSAPDSIKIGVLHFTAVAAEDISMVVSYTYTCTSLRSKLHFLKVPKPTEDIFFYYVVF